MNKDPGGHIWPDNEDRCLRCGLGAYEAEGMVCRGKTLDTPLHALERALRPTSSRPYPLAEDVLAALIAMGWTITHLNDTGGWRSVSDPPPYDLYVLLRRRDGSILSGFRTTRGYVTRFNGYAFDAEWWMPCPPPVEGCCDA